MSVPALLIAAIGLLVLVLAGLLIVIGLQNHKIGETSPLPALQQKPDGTLQEARQKILTLLQNGSKTGAIRIYRIITGVGLKEAKEAVEAIERGEDPTSRPAPPTPEANWRARVEEARRQNKKIEAIKIYRQATGVGLKEAKEAVEALERGGGVP